MAIASIHNLYVHQMDVQTAFINGDPDDEIYMEQPPGFINSNFPNHVCRLH